MTNLISIITYARILCLLLQHQSRTSAKVLLLVFSLICLPEILVLCSLQLKLPFVSSTQIAPQQDSMTVNPPTIQDDSSRDVELFFDDHFYLCKSAPKPKDYEHLIISAILRPEPLQPFKSNCTEKYHRFYLLTKPGRLAKSLITQSNYYIVMFSQTTNVVLYKNNIITIHPNYFCNLRNVTNLEISGNSIASSESFGFNQQCFSNNCCPTLRRLQLTNNNLKVLVSRSFCGFPNLEDLDLSQNHIDTVDDNAFVRLGNLLTLSMRDNHLHTLPQNVFLALKRLLALDLSTNRFNSSIFDRLSSQLALKVLRLSENGITEIQGSHINGLEHLSELYLDYNSIYSLGLAFEKVNSIERLKLNGNEISHISDTTFASLVNLTFLELSFNTISHLNGTLFSFNKNLAYLDISNNNLFSIPDLKLVKSLRKLVIVNNMFTTINQKDGNIICEMQNLEELYLGFNYITNISEGAFDCNLTLKVLNLNKNNLRSIRGTFASAKITKLIIALNMIEELQLDDIPEDVVEADFSNNLITTLYSPFKQRLRKMSLSILNLEDNLLTDLAGVHLPPSLEYLLLNNNKLQFLDLGNFKVTFDNTYFALENLKLLSIPSNSIRSFCRLIFYLYASKTYPDIDLQDNPLSCDCEIAFLEKNTEKIRPGQPFPRLRKFGNCQSWEQSNENKNLSSAFPMDRFSCQAAHFSRFCSCNLNNFYSATCNFPCPKRCSCYLSKDYRFQFINCIGAAYDSLPVMISQLPLHLHVQFANNALKSINETMLRSYSKTVELHLNDNRIMTIETWAFKGLTYLKILNLKSNLLSSLPDGAFENLFELTELYLAHNRLMHFNIQVFQPLRSIREIQLHDNNLKDVYIWNIDVSSTSVRLSLRNNPWSCDCDYIVQFRSWLQNYSYIVKDVNKLFCTSDNIMVQNSPILSFNSSQCYVLKEKVLFTNVVLWTSVFASLFVVLLMCVMAFFYRREMQVLVYSNYGLRLFHKNSEDLDADKPYDAFIAHSALDEEFLAKEIVPRLENIQQPYRLCIHQRDFLVGAVITESILEAVEKSKRTIVLLSENFVRSEWCRFEFKSAHLKTMSDRCNRLIVITLGKLPTDLEPEMKLYLKTNTYLEWGDRLFWEKLYFALPDRISH